MKTNVLLLSRRVTWTVIGLGLFAHAYAAEVPNVEDLSEPARQQLNSEFRTKDTTILQNALISARNELATKALSEPAQLAVATLLFRTPQSESSLPTMIEGAQLIEVVSRTPVGKRGVIYSAGWRIDPNADVAESLKEGAKQFKTSLASPAAGADPTSIVEQQELVNKELQYVSAKVIARHDQLDKAASRMGVLAVLLQDEEASRREIQASRKIPLRKTSQRNGTAVSPMAALAGEEYPDAPPDSANGVPENGVGKPCLGASCWVVSYDTYCNTKVGTKKYGACPGNLYWLPGTYGGIVSRDFQIRPEYDAEGHKVGANGWTKTILRWSATAPKVNFGGQMRPMTSASFLAPLATPCNFVYSMSPVVPCDSSPNQIYVADSTYESELLLPNPECTMSSRTGTLDDALAGCYVWTNWSSNFPSAYPDTTFADGAATYNSAVGSAAMSDMVLGATYTNVLYFRQNRPYISIIGMQAFLSAQIGTRVPASCYTTWCSFQTKGVQLQSIRIVAGKGTRWP